MWWLLFLLASFLITAWVVRPLAGRRTSENPDGEDGPAARGAAIEAMDTDETTPFLKTAGPNPRSDRRLAVAIVVLVPVVATALYLHTGNPGLPDQPYAQRDQAPVALDRKQADMFEATMARVREQPDDPESWFAAGQLLLAADKAEIAARLLAQAVSLAPERADILEFHGEALVSAAEGQVTDDARLTFERVLSLDPGNPRSRHYLALANYQNGQLETALRDWSALAHDAPPNAAWLDQVKERIGDTARQLGVDAGAWLPPSRVSGPRGREEGME